MKKKRKGEGRRIKGFSMTGPVVTVKKTKTSQLARNRVQHSVLEF